MHLLFQSEAEKRNLFGTESNESKTAAPSPLGKGREVGEEGVKKRGLGAKL